MASPHHHQWKPCAGQGASGHVGFPLTPALSLRALRERENRPQPVGESEIIFSSPERAWLPPLPKGEGWGEGEQSVYRRQMAVLPRCALSANARAHSRRANTVPHHRNARRALPGPDARGKEIRSSQTRLTQTRRLARRAARAAPSDGSGIRFRSSIRPRHWCDETARPGAPTRGGLPAPTFRPGIS